MTEEKKKESKIIITTLSGNVTGGIGSSNTGQNSGGTIIISSSKKTCKICHQTVGINHQNACQCERRGSYCGYCERDENYQETACTCYAKKSDQKSEISSSQTKDKQEELSRDETSEMVVDKIEVFNQIKVKLKSHSQFLPKQKERNKQLTMLFNQLPTTPEKLIKALNSIKAGLSKRLTKQEINSLYQKQVSQEPQDQANQIQKPLHKTEIKLEVKNELLSQQQALQQLINSIRLVIPPVYRQHLDN
jgi:hypothetical protein